MGILTSQQSSQKKTKFRRFLINHRTLICFLLFTAGIVYFGSLADPSRTNATYFSENALLPGLVYSEIRSETVNHALHSYDELRRERETYRSMTPSAWIQAKFRQIGLETYAHNFTLNYPLGGGRVFRGRNIYGILRAPKIGSTEAIVISAPYRSVDSIHPDVMHSIPIMLAFAKFARKQKYWSKDLIFVVTEQEQLGMQAWLEAYYGSDACDSTQILDCGELKARAGQIQAAINLEISSFDIDYIDVKIEGLNGQLPNLDLVNLIQRLAAKEGIISGHKLTSAHKRIGAKSSIEDNLRHLLSMIMTQATGIPTGNHGLFLRYGVQAITLEGHKREQSNYQRQTNGANSILRLLEGTTRSLNNLLERFHQSFFFYLLVSSDRFVSIGDYMPTVGILAAALLIKAFIIWLKINGRSDSENSQQKNAESESIPSIIDLGNISFISVGAFLIVAHAFGAIAANLPFFTSLDAVFHEYGVKTEVYLFYSLWLVSLITLPIPLLFNFTAINVEVLHIAALLEAATVLIVVSMLNFSLALLLSVILVPLAILIDSNHTGLVKWFIQFICLLFNPIVVVYLLVLAFTWQSFPEMTFFAITHRALTASMDAVTFSIVDSIIYGNWLYPLVTLVLLPIWLTFFSILCIRPIKSQPKSSQTELRDNKKKQ